MRVVSRGVQNLDRILSRSRRLPSLPVLRLRPRGRYSTTMICVLSRRFLHALTLLIALCRLSAVSGAPLLFGGEGLRRVAPVILDDTGIAANVELSKVDSGSWAAQYDRVSHWFDNPSFLRLRPSEGTSLKMGAQLSIFNLGGGSYKVVNKSKEWQNINFKDQGLVHVIAPKSTEVISSDSAGEFLQVFSLPRQQGPSTYRYSSDS